MVIRQQPVEDFLNRKVKTFEWMKDISEEELDKVIDDLSPAVRFHTDPRLHQKVCFLIGIDKECLIFLLDLGTGKTKIILDVFLYRKLAGECSCGLVLVPNVVNIRGFYLECRKHTPELKCIRLKGGSKRRLELLQKHGDLFVLNYQGLVAFCTKRVRNKGRNRDKKKWKTVLNNKRIKILADMFDFIVLDESTAVQNKMSLTSRVCRQLVKTIPLRYEMTGTPFGKDPIAFWSQFFLLDNGATLGETLGLYRAAFYTMKKNYWGGRDYTFDKKKTKILRRFVKSRSIRYEITDCYDMPEQNWVPVELDLPDEARTYYDEVVQGVIKARRNFEIQKNSFIKLRQICSGFLGVKDDDKKIEIVFRGNPKLDALMQKVSEVPEGKKMLIFHEFILSGRFIGEALKDEGIDHERLWSGTKDKDKVLDRFMFDPDCRFFVVNNSSGSFGLNLQVACYSVYYETPVDPLIRVQTEGRTWRDGQEFPVVYFDLFMRRTIEEKMLWSLEQDKNLFKELVNGREKWV